MNVHWGTGRGPVGVQGAHHPLGFYCGSPNLLSPHHAGYHEGQYNGLLCQALVQLGERGWIPDESTDCLTVCRTGRIRWQFHGVLTASYTYESVTFRFRRAAP